MYRRDANFLLSFLLNIYKQKCFGKCIFPLLESYCPPQTRPSSTLCHSWNGTKVSIQTPILIPRWRTLKRQVETKLKSLTLRQRPDLIQT